MRVATESRWNVKRRHHPYMLLCYLLYFNRKGYLLYMLSYVLFMLELRTAVHAVLSTVHAALRLCYNIYCTRCATTCSTAWLRAHLVTERTYRPGLEPSLDTVQVKYVPTASKCDGQAVLVVWRRVRLFKFTEATRLCVKHNAKNECENITSEQSRSLHLHEAPVHVISYDATLCPSKPPSWCGGTGVRCSTHRTFGVQQ